MKLLSMVIMIVLGIFWSAFAQQPTPLSLQEQLDRVRLELAYTDREHTMCKQSLADMWARANGFEVQLRQAVDELKALKDKQNAPVQKK